MTSPNPSPAEGTVATPAGPAPVDHPGQLPRLTVIGTGYLGATHAACMASLGYQVLGVDVDERKLAILSAGGVPFFEPGLPELVRKGVESGNLRFTSSYQEAAEFGDVHFICVGTPQMKGSQAADMAYVDASIESLAPYLDRKVLVVGKSTVPVGTAERLAERVRELAPAGDQVELAWNPEFLREGFAIEDTLHPDRMVFGVTSAWAEEQLRLAFKPVLEQGVPTVVTDLATAQLVKAAANSFLATKISFINAMAEICERTGADVTDLALSLSYDDRIGGKFLKPGLGFGGGCLPKDIRAFAYRAAELGVGKSISFLQSVDEINNRRRERTVDLAEELVGGRMAGLRVACLGAAFKPNSDDIRDAPALDVAYRLYRLGAEVTVYDPEAMPNAKLVRPELNYADSAFAAAVDADLVILATEWNEFREIVPSVLGEIVSQRRILDGRHALDRDAWTAAGWEYRALGRRH
jgi:UDPglucose 6-dehydrogenase